MYIHLYIFWLQATRKTLRKWSVAALKCSIMSYKSRKENTSCLMYKFVLIQYSHSMVCSTLSSFYIEMLLCRYKTVSSLNPDQYLPHFVLLGGGNTI